MFELQTHWPALVELLSGTALRVWLVVAGLLVAGHYHAMANATQRAPVLIKYLALPLLTGAGVGMVWAGYTGNAPAGGLYSAAAAGLMVTVNLAVWASGAYVSTAFERAAEVREQIRREGHLFVDSVRTMAEAVHVPDTDAAPLQAEPETRQREAQR